MTYEILVGVYLVLKESENDFINEMFDCIM